MGLFDKVKNLFTEEVEEEPIRKEIKPVETVKPSIELPDPVEEKEVKEPVKTREEKFVFFTDDDFKDLEKPKKEEIKKVEKKEEKRSAYNGASFKPQQEVKKEFKPSPIISPVYGVLDKNYKKEEIVTKKSPTVYHSSKITIDDIRNKAYGTVEDEIKDDILGRALIEDVKEEVVEPDINIFEELDNIEEKKEPVKESTNDVDEIFGRLNVRKEEILDELDEKKEEILDEIDNKTNNSFELLSKEFNDDFDDYDDEDLDLETTKEDVNVAKELLDDDETIELARELEEQKKKLNEINNMMDENEKVTKTKSKKKKEKVEDDLEESELFDLIDSTYDKDDE